MGGSPSRPVFSAPSQEVGAVADQLPPAAWCPFVLRVVACRDRFPGPDAWLLLHRNPATHELKCYLSNGPEGMAPDRLVWLGRPTLAQRAVLPERRDGKQLFGLGDYEDRSWQDWYRHTTFVMLSHFFVVRETLRLNKSTPAGPCPRPVCSWTRSCPAPAP